MVKKLSFDSLTEDTSCTGKHREREHNSINNDLHTKLILDPFLPQTPCPGESFHPYLLVVCPWTPHMLEGILHSLLYCHRDNSVGGHHR